MQPLEWWALQTVSLGALLACTTLAYAASGRVGRHTSYGGFLFVICGGFWLLATGLAAYIATVAVDAWHGPPGWGDAFTMSGWGMIVIAFYLLLVKFPPAHQVAPRHKAQTYLLPLGAGALFALFGWAYATRSGLLPDAEGIVRIAYLFLDGVLLSVFALTLGVLRRLGRASLGVLYRYLGVALVLKSLADVLFTLWPRDSPLGLINTAIYPAAGLVAVVGLALHHRAVAPLAERHVLADPAFVVPQLVLRDAATRMRGIAGVLGERLVLGTGEQALSDAGYPAHVQEGVIFSSASQEAWGDAVRAARARSVAVLGPTADEVFHETLITYGGNAEGPA